MKSPKVCIVGLKCHDLISGNPEPRYLGGIETMLVFLAKALVREGCEVSLITYDHDQPVRQLFDDVTVLKSFNPDVGVRGLRIVSHAKQLWSTMKEADADVYLQMGAGVETALVALGCRGHEKKNGKHFVFCLAHDRNFGESLRAGRLGWEGKAYRYGLRQADLIVSQTQHQREELQKAVGLDSEVITIAAAASASDNGGAADSKGASNGILWAGRIVPVKRLEWLLEVARRCPEYQFDVAGAPNTSSDYASKVVQEAQGLSNVKLHGRVGAAQMDRLYQKAQLFCNTSISEGFPNTYPEAWSHGLPVVATFDPDGIIARQGLGRISSDVDGLVNGIQELLGDEQTYNQASRAARHYYDENHSPAVVARRFCWVFEMLAAQP